MTLFGDATAHNTHVELRLRDGGTVSRSTYYRKKHELCARPGCQCAIVWSDRAGRALVPIVGPQTVAFEWVTENGAL